MLLFVGQTVDDFMLTLVYRVLATKYSEKLEYLHDLNHTFLETMSSHKHENKKPKKN